MLPTLESRLNQMCEDGKPRSSWKSGKRQAVDVPPQKWGATDGEAHSGGIKAITANAGLSLRAHTDAQQIWSEKRAKRIAGTYARFYLEMERGSDPSKKGRFYWMALGAFASKTVACTLALYRVKLLPWVTDGLGKGNFWLFCDISGWHWYYANHARSFDACKESRSALAYDDNVKKLVRQLPWQEESLPVIRQLGISPHIRSGFAKVREFESTSDKRRSSKIQYEHLIAIANHEQGEVLQPLIYNNRVFSGSVAAQRAPVLNCFSPDVELVFSHACQTETKGLKSVPPEGTKIEDFTSRMAWITKAADQFHLLMQESRSFMEKELRTMAGWVDLPDR